MGGQVEEGAEAAGLALTNPMALALSDRRLIVFGIETSAMGKPKAVKELVSAVPVGEVESIQVKRLLVGKTMTVSANGAAGEARGRCWPGRKGPRRAVRAREGERLAVRPRRPRSAKCLVRRPVEPINGATAICRQPAVAARERNLA